MIRPYPRPACGIREAGRAGEAIPLFKRPLADRERVLGHDHPDTLKSRNNLAAAYRATGRSSGGTGKLREESSNNGDPKGQGIAPSAFGRDGTEHSRLHPSTAQSGSTSRTR